MDFVNSDLWNQLEALAYRESVPFCLPCYVDAPSGRCPNCDSDDLARHRPGEGVEWGVDWIVQQLVGDNVDRVDTDEAFDAMISEAYGDTAKVGWVNFDVSSTIRTLDPVSWHIAKADWLDAQVCDGIFLTLDNGETYYRTEDVRIFAACRATSVKRSSTGSAPELTY